MLFRSINKLTRLKRERDPQAVADAIAALARNAEGGNGNLLALAVDAARAKASLPSVMAGVVGGSRGLGSEAAQS